MRYLLLLLLVILVSCESHSFESDKRQIIAKDQIREKLHKARNFDITGFKQDTLQTYTDTTIKRPLRYALDFVYTDSLGVVQKKKGVVIFTPDGNSVLNAQIID
jgi:outer membrane lipoprotein-sorting protein